MNPKKKKPGESGPSVPAYIVTFSDMVTLLLTFFVLLLSMSSDQNTSKFKIGQDSFKRSLANFGLKGLLYSLSTTSDFEDQQVYNPIDDPDENSITPTNAKEEQLRRLFMKLNDKMDVRPSQIKGKLIDLMTPDLSFSANSSDLTDKHRQNLSEICSELSLTQNPVNFTIYVVGLASKIRGNQQWITAAQRSAAVAEYMQSKLPDNFKVYNWGTSNPAEWTRATHTKDLETDILIAVLQ